MHVREGAVHRVKRFILVLLLLVAVVATLMFSLENQQPVSLTFLGWSTPPWAVSMYVLTALLVGLAIGPLLSLMLYRRHKAGPGRG
ncbi:lipopolysaccharide assembly protein LapA domain-containing protein [Pseudomonas koreensis]|uniref:lipopolysaccharide assembly protein LapA domain-containing protein n=1 Tax=Pseudomonas koreensis TaxID=198620 RepID=UPI001AA0BBBE